MRLGGGVSRVLNLRGLRAVCDNSVPRLILPKQVHHRPDVIEVSGFSPVTVEWVVPAPLPSRELRAARPNPGGFKRTVLYMHGGAYVLCNPGALRGITYKLSEALDALVCVPNYRRPPDHPAPAQIEDGLAVYAHLLEVSDVEIVLAGDSAGGGIAAAMLLEMQGRCMRMPQCALLVSPWTDIGDGGLRHVTTSNSQKDYLHSGTAQWIAKTVRGNLEGEDARISPMYTEDCLTHMPPLFVMYGTSELLCGQVQQFCRAWTAKGARIESWGVSGLAHVPLLFCFCNEQARRGLQRMERFLQAIDARDKSPDKSLEDKFYSFPVS
eukprot:CAMPEP_0194489610 /NCGR_PEP_ID=MMETSP0253-20130528/9093_1 /TAXON_ID=2966 /ORGANISM="Noctiluca scintillans" /LENGTH=323 /DNA_ID=CAMNT_0039330105 /DNA_START=27 /DNA_END=998 /DNA_ORIENTATION=+